MELARVREMKSGTERLREKVTYRVGMILRTGEVTDETGESI